MKLSTKALLSSLVAASVNCLPSRRQLITQREARRYEKILEKHDRKGELRASVLGIESPDFREKERHQSLASIVRRYGFENEQAFYLALLGKIRDELHRRGWSLSRIEAYEMGRLARLA
jgi:hypothetical protein